MEITRYSDKDLKHFKSLIEEKIQKAQNDLALIKSAYMNDGNNGTEDTSPTFKAFEEGSQTMSKEANTQLAIRQEKFIRDLQGALIRIENKTYGVCRVTGKLINKKRLELVPHATLSIEAKNMQKKFISLLNSATMTLKKSLLIVFLILVVDQVSKIYIKLNFPLTLYGELPLFDLGWFKLLFIENKGMAWGATINDFIPFISERNGKLFLTLFRMVAVTFIFYWLYNSIKQNANKLLVISLSLILAGAIGNIIDSVFYGYLFTNSYYNIAQYSPGNGYESIFYGHVVDMLQFPIFSWEWPSWIPYFGGESFTFFEPVFNIADSAISIGVGIMLVFNRKIYPENS